MANSSWREYIDLREDKFVDAVPWDWDTIGKAIRGVLEGDPVTGRWECEEEAPGPGGCTCPCEDHTRCGLCCPYREDLVAEETLIASTPDGRVLVADAGAVYLAPNLEELQKRIECIEQFLDIRPQERFSMFKRRYRFS